MSESEQPQLQFEPPETERDWLGLQIDHRQFFDALQDEWLLPLPGEHGRILAVKAHAERTQKQYGQKGKLITVNLRFEPRFLPSVKAFVLSDGEWRLVAIDSLPRKAELVFWPGAIPLFSVTQVATESLEEQTRLVGLARQVSNLSMPETVADADRVRVRSLRDIDVPKRSEGLELRKDYGHVLGAMTMAMWAVPRVDPWFDMLVASFSANKIQLQSALDTLEAPHFGELPWLPSSAKLVCETFDCSLWRGAFQTFVEMRQHGQLDATGVVKQIEKYSTGSSKHTGDRAKEWSSETRSLLCGKLEFSLEGWEQSIAGKALQMLLLRPEPDHFVGWRQDLPSMPPAVWFSAAILLGFLNEYRRLPKAFRGGPIQRRTFVAHAFDVTNESLNWPFPCARQMIWRRKDDDTAISCDETELLTKAAHPRSLWYRANLDDKLVGRAADELARKQNWNCFKRQLQLRDTSIPLHIQSNSALKLEERTLVVNGSVNFELPDNANVTTVFDKDSFRQCLAVEGASNIQPPPGDKHSQMQSTSVIQTKITHPDIHGLSQVEEYLSFAEEEELVSQIEAAEWLQVLKRRVQHYGWRYDYKAKRVKRDMHIGPLPQWAARIAERLAREELLPYVPDQVIVNEYVGSQGISKHVDCEPCFEDGIVMLSLLESWEMNFWRGREKLAQMLPRRSVTILHGESRYDWKHEIPKRMKEPNGLRRVRRISVTFRKVILENSTDSCGRHY